MKCLTNDWSKVLEQESQKSYYIKLWEFLKQEYQNQTIYPDMYEIYAAFHYTSYHQTKVVILGQDPYHGSGQAHGFSFSVRPGVTIPPSLKNIYKELQQDLGISIPNHGCLIPWAKQGVLLLNTVLTVRGNQADSHRGKGWERLTDRVIEALNDRDKPIVFILWGRNAQAKRKKLDEDKHLIITAPHPSPLSAYRGFFGSEPFSKANQFLESIGETPIDWQLPAEINET